MALMGVALGATYAGVGFVAREMAVGYVIAPLLGGVLAALFGARRVILISMMVAAAITLVVGGLSGKEYAQVPWALVGVAAGSCLASAVGLAGAWFGPRERGIAAGITIAGIPLGWLAVAFMKSTILHTGGADAWRYGLTPIGAVVALLGLVAFLLARDGPCVAARSGTGQTDRAPSRPPIRWGLVYANATVWLLCAIGISSGLAISISAPTFMGRSTLSLLDWGLGSSPSGTLFAVSAAVGSLSWGLASGRTGRRPALAAAYCILYHCSTLKGAPLAVGSCVRGYGFGSPYPLRQPSCTRSRGGGLGGAADATSGLRPCIALLHRRAGGWHLGMGACRRKPRRKLCLPGNCGTCPCCWHNVHVQKGATRSGASTRQRPRRANWIPGRGRQIERTPPRQHFMWAKLTVWLLRVLLNLCRCEWTAVSEKRSVCRGKGARH